MNSKELYAIREWAPLTDIIERIPARVQKGLFPVDLNITCIDAVPEFLALGSSAGIVFWYSRHSGEVQKLRAETSTRITCVKIVNSVEYMVAAGNASGQVSIFQIQKELPADLNLMAPYVRAKPIERYTIRDLHNSAITCCEWSKNGMKLYSGDRQGIVVLTEFDYQSHLSKSVEILSEAYEIVQLSVQQSFLLVSTLYRSIVCQRKQKSAAVEWQIIQVGKKDRKQLADCGGTFLKGGAGKQPLLLCGRPGLRFWVADTHGNVEKTMLFKEAVARNATWEIPILNPKGSKRDSNENLEATNFGRLYLFGGSETLLVTHDDEARLYILNLSNLRVEAVAKGCRKICDMCVCDKEIFILEGERSLLRLAPMPEKPNKIATIIFNPSMPPPVPLLGSMSNSNFCESPVEYEFEEEAAVINAEECFELSPIDEFNLNIPIELAVESPRSEQNRRLEIFQQISEMDFDHSILHHSGISTNGRRRSTEKNSARSISAKSEGIVEIARAAAGTKLMEPKEKPKHLEFTTNQATIMDASFCNETNNSSNRATFIDHLPNVLSPNTLKKTIEQKAKQLAEEYDIPVVQLEHITAEQLRQSQVLAAAPQTEQQPKWQLPLVYPQQHVTKLEDAGVQTTPRKKNYFISDDCDFSAGQPVDDICQTLRATNIDDEVVTLQKCVDITNDPLQQRPLQFVPSQPVGEDIHSFLLDFSRARDPMHIVSPPASGDSNTSSEWEFLDN